MADFTIIRARRHRIRDGFAYEGVATWPTTDVTATLPIKDLSSKVRRALMFAAGGTVTAATLTDAASRSLSASVAATSDFTFRMPRTGTVTAVAFDTSASIAASDSTYWTFGLLNKTAASVVVDNTAAANSTKLTGGSATTAFTSFPLTLAAGVAVTATALYQLNITKTSTPAAITGLSLTVSYTYTGAQDEFNFAPAADATSGYFPATAGKVTFTRSGNSPVNNQRVQFYIETGI